MVFAILGEVCQIMAAQSEFQFGVAEHFTPQTQLLDSLWTLWVLFMGTRRSVLGWDSLTVSYLSGCFRGDAVNRCAGLNPRQRPNCSFVRSRHCFKAALQSFQASFEQQVEELRADWDPRKASEPPAEFSQLVEVIISHHIQLWEALLKC